jgi:hypothetical protein
MRTRSTKIQCKMCVPGNVKFCGKCSLITIRMGADLYSRCFHPETHIIILHLRGNYMTPTF